LVREAESATVVSAHMQAGATPGIGYVRVAAFTPGVATHLQTEIASLARQGATRLVIDLRGTSEGAYDEGIKAARLFVPAGGVIATLESKGQSTPAGQRAGEGDGAVRRAVAVASAA